MELTPRLTNKSRALFLLISVQLFFPMAAAGSVRTRGAASNSLKAQLQATDNQVTPLVFGKNVCKTLAPKQSDLYEFEIKEGGQPGYIHVEVMQKGIDVTLFLSGPGSYSISRDWPNGRYGLESLSADALAPGSYTLRVKGTDARAGEAAEYCLRSESKAAPTEGDVKRVKAEQALAAGLDALTAAVKARSRDGFVAAVNAIRDAADLWKGLDEYGYATALTTYSYQAFSVGVLPGDKALEIFKETQVLWHRIGDIRREAQALSNIAQVYDRANKINDADYYYNESLRLFRLPETPKVPLEEAAILNNLATIKQQEGYYPEALQMLDSAVKKLEEEKNFSKEAVFKDAVSLSNMGGIYLDLEDYATADEFFRRAQEVRGKPEADFFGWASTAHNWGLSRAYQGDFDQGTRLLAEALRIRKAIQDPRALETRYAQGFVSNMRGDFDGALTIFEKEVLPQLENRPFQKAITLSSIGLIYRVKGDRQKALQTFQSALDTSAQVTNPNVKILTLFDLGRAEMELDKLDTAAEYLKKAIDLIEERRTRIINPEWRATYFASTRNVYETYVQLLIRMDDPVKALEYSERSRARSLVDLLLEAKINVFQGDEDTGRVKQYHDIQREMEAEQTRLQGLEFVVGAPEARKAELRQRITALGAQLRLLDAAAKSDKGSRPLLPEPLHLSDMQKLLDGDTVLLEFLLGQDKSYLWILSNTGKPSLVPLPSRAEIETSALKVYGLLTARDKDNPIRAAGSGARLNLPSDVAAADKAYPAVAAELSRTLLGGATKMIAGKRLLIVPDGALALIPFAALPLPSTSIEAGPPTADWKPMLLEHVIVMLPSATALSVQRDVFGSRPAAPKTLAVFADPVFDRNDEPHRCEKQPQAKAGAKAGSMSDDAQFRSATLGRAIGHPGTFNEEVKMPRLSFTQEEMKAILATSPKGPKLSACGFDANYDFTTKHLSDFRFLHFATHGIVNTEHPELSGIVLSLVDRKGDYTPEGFLRLTEIYDLRLKADLVVLSACYTALGRDIKGEGPISLTRGFMYTGARRVVASLWQVKDKSTVELMKYFYQEIKRDEDLPAATALQRAQIRVRQEHPDWPPFFWAAFTANGEYK